MVYVFVGGFKLICFLGSKPYRAEFIVCMGGIDAIAELTAGVASIAGMLAKKLVLLWNDI